MRRAVVLVAGVAALLAIGGCRAMLRYPTAPPSRDALARFDIAGEMNPYVLTGLVYPKLVVEIDAVDGYEPEPRAIASLRRILEESVEPGRAFDVVRDDTIPRAEWDALEDKERSDPLAERYLDHVPDPRGDTEVIYVLYVPQVGGTGLFGSSSGWIVHRGDRELLVDGLVMCFDAFRAQSRLWIGPGKIDEATLVHEFGHVLGLTTRPEHEQLNNPAHCANPQCLMTHPRLRSIVYNAPRAIFTGNLPRNYCKDCREDIVAARRAWRESAAADPAAFRERFVRRREATLAMIAARRAKEAGHEDEARATLLALRDAELDDRARNRLAYQLEEIGESEAATAIRRELARAGARVDARENLAGAAAARGAYAEVLEWLPAGYVADAARDAMRSYGVRAVMYRANALWALGRRGEAAEVLEDAGRVGSWNSSGYWLRAAELRRRAGDPRAARRCLKAIPRDWRRTTGYDLAALEVDSAARGTSVPEGALREILLTAESRKDDYGRARVLARLGRGPEALGLYDAQERRDACFRAELAATAGDVAETWNSLERCSTTLAPGSWADPCVAEAFDALRPDPRFRALFPHCPVQ